MPSYFSYEPEFIQDILATDKSSTFMGHIIINELSTFCSAFSEIKYNEIGSVSCTKSPSPGSQPLMTGFLSQREYELTYYNLLSLSLV